MLTLPEYWCIANTDQIIRDWFTKEYDEPEILIWRYDYIGYDECDSHNGVHGVGSIRSFEKNNIEITLEDFKRLVLKKEPEDLSYLIKFFKNLNIC